MVNGVVQREPTVLAGIVLAGLPALFGFLEAFGLWEPSEAQKGALTALYSFVAVLVIYLLRGQVWSPASVAELREGRDGGDLPEA